MTKKSDQAWLELLDLMFARSPYDRLIYQWCEAKDQNNIERVQEIELEIEELREQSASIAERSIKF